MKLDNPIYLDYNSTTPVDPDVFESMKPYFLEHFGNPSSKLHTYGWAADKAVQNARKQVAALVKGEAKEIIFTGGATESNNLALRGVFQNYAKNNEAHIITTATEHSSVLETVEDLKYLNAKVTILPVNEYGQVTPEQVENAITENTILVSVILANNEIGTLNPIRKIGKITSQKGIIFHTDAVQALGRFELNVNDLKVDLMSITAHKMYGPKGVGALYVRQLPNRIKLRPLVTGGGQELGLRAGTLNVPSIVGFGKACELAQLNFHEENFAISELRNNFLKNLLTLPGTHLNGHPTERLNNNISIRFDNILNTDLIRNLKNVACSTGSACSSEQAKVSPVLTAIGLDLDQIKSTVRFGLGRFTKAHEIDYVFEKIRNYLKYREGSQGLENVLEL